MDLLGTYIFVVMVVISFVLHIISLKKWFDNRLKNEKLLEMIESLQTSKVMRS